nr:Imm49 family immunity protein [Nocardia abscessus]
MTTNSTARSPTRCDDTREYWTATEDRAMSSEGLVALDLLAIACLAYDAGFPIDIESEYLPTALLEYAWVGEIDT